MKRIISLLLVFSLVLSLFTFSVNADNATGIKTESRALTGNELAGDLNGDGNVNAVDVVSYRRHASGGYSVEINEELRDVNNDGLCNAKDITLIRRFITGGYNVELELPNNGNVINLANLPTSGTFTEAGYPETQSVLNFESGGQNSSTNHSIGVVDLSKYSKIIVTYGTDPTVTGDVTVVLKTRSSNLTSAIFLPAKGWTDTTTTATFDVAAFSNNEELVLAMASNAFGFAINKIELVEATEDSGNMGSGEIATEDSVIDLTKLPTSGAFTAAGINDLILNFNSGGTNSKSKHSIGNIDLSAYNSMRITYSNDPTLSTVGTLAVYNSTSEIALASKFLKPSGGWKNFAEATIDISKVNNFEEIFLALEHESGGIAVTQVVLSPTALPNLTPTDGRVDTTLVNKILAEAQTVSNFARDNGFTYGNAAFNPGITWKSLNINAPATNTDERLSSCDRFVGWVLYRVGFTEQPEKNGYFVLQLASWLESLNFQKITDVSQLKAGDIVFTNHDTTKPGNPGHVFLCASDNLGGNVYLRYDHGSTERIKCQKNTCVTPGQQPFKEVIGDFFYAYRPNSTALG